MSEISTEQAQKVRNSILSEKIEKLKRAVCDIREHPGDPLLFSGLRDAADTVYDLLKNSEDYMCKLELEKDDEYDFYDGPKGENMEKDKKSKSVICGYGTIPIPSGAHVSEDKDYIFVRTKEGETITYRKNKEDKEDNVNHPSHYESSCSLECIDVMECCFGAAAVFDFSVCNCFKYLWRYKNKNGEEDLKKAAWYKDRAHYIYDNTTMDEEEISRADVMLDRIDALYTATINKK